MYVCVSSLVYYIIHDRYPHDECAVRRMKRYIYGWGFDTWKNEKQSINWKCFSFFEFFIIKRNLLAISKNTKLEKCHRLVCDFVVIVNDVSQMFTLAECFICEQLTINSRKSYCFQFIQYIKQKQTKPYASSRLQFLTILIKNSHFIFLLLIIKDITYTKVYIMWETL